MIGPFQAHDVRGQAGGEPPLGVLCEALRRQENPGSQKRMTPLPVCLCGMVKGTV